MGLEGGQGGNKTVAGDELDVRDVGFRREGRGNVVEMSYARAKTKLFSIMELARMTTVSRRYYETVRAATTTMSSDDLTEKLMNPHPSLLRFILIKVTHTTPLPPST